MMLAGASFAKLKALVRVVFARLQARRLVGNHTKLTVFPLVDMRGSGVLKG